MRKSSGLSASSRSRTLDRSVRTISRLRIEGTTKCSRIPVVSDLAAIWGLLPSEVASAPTRLMAEISQPTDPAATGVAEADQAGASSQYRPDSQSAQRSCHRAPDTCGCAEPRKCDPWAAHPRAFRHRLESVTCPCGFRYKCIGQRPPRPPRQSSESSASRLGS
jgi:hypothetical protein